ncbi:MAG: N-acetyltransferase, partial [Chitinophagaceae bacterium]|nr:N-acetyltransferase [Chitinophagaceae bacterium]
MKSSEIIIAPAIPEDAEVIQKVFYDTWLATYPNEEFNITVEDLEYRHRNIFIPENIEERKRSIREMKDNELFLTAKVSGEIVGVGYFKIEPARNKLQAMYVLPGYQGKGIGKMFWGKVKSFFDSEKDIYVEVVEYNTKAINFYKSLGFKDTGKRFSEERFRMRNGAIFPEMEMVLKA